MGHNFAEFLKPRVFCLIVYWFSFLVVLCFFLLFLLARLAIPLEIMSKVGFREDTLISTRSRFYIKLLSVLENNSVKTRLQHLFTFACVMLLIV